jgi:site-specific DNA-methyltransferase (adenine-specific)
MIELNKIYNEDCLEGMKRIPDGSVDLTVTSPPYDNLRSYNGNIDQWSFEKFQAIAKELYRVTDDGGVVVWVVADATIKGSETGSSFKQALYFKDCGFNLHDTMIYAKNNPIPQNHNRYEQQFEYMFVFSKGKPNTFNPIKVRTKTGGKEYSWKNANDYGSSSAKRKRDEVSVVKKEKNQYNIWFMSVASSKYTNSAPFPEQLANDHIISWSNEGDIVLDPFMGSGTTAVACINTNRNYIGFELDKHYCDIANERIQKALAEKEAICITI